jgi:hypothetical protein
MTFLCSINVFVNPGRVSLIIEKFVSFVLNKIALTMNNKASFVTTKAIEYQ